MTKWQIVLGIEVVALMIALIMPLTPSKTGSDWGFAHLIVAEPSYLHQVAAGLVVVNVLLGLLAVAFLVWGREREPTSDEPEGPAP